MGDISYGSQAGGCRPEAGNEVQGYGGNMSGKGSEGKAGDCSSSTVFLPPSMSSVESFADLPEEIVAQVFASLVDPCDVSSGESFADLPEEIVAQVFASLVDPRDVFRAGMTCRSWRRVSNSPDAWRKVEVGCKLGIKAFYSRQQGGEGAVGGANAMAIARRGVPTSSAPASASVMPAIRAGSAAGAACHPSGLTAVVGCGLSARKPEADEQRDERRTALSASEDGEAVLVREESSAVRVIEIPRRNCCSFCSPFVRFLSSRGRAIQEIAITEASAGHKDPVSSREMCVLLEGCPNLRNVLLYHVPSWTVADYRACLRTLAANCRQVELLLIDSESMDSSLLLKIPSLRGLMLSNWCRTPKDDQGMCDELSRFLLRHPGLKHLVLRVESARECHIDLRSQSLISLNMSKSRNILVRSATCPYLEEFGARGFRSEGGRRALKEMESIVKRGCPNLKLFAY